MPDPDATDAVGHIVSERMNRLIALVQRWAAEGRAEQLLELTRRVEAEVCLAESLPVPMDGVHPALAKLIRDEFPEGFPTG